MGMPLYERQVREREEHSYHNRIESIGSIGNRTLNRFDKYILSKIQANWVEPIKPADF